MQELGIKDASDALTAVQELLDAESIVAVFATPNGDVSMIADRNGVSIYTRGEMVPLEDRP